MKQYPGRLKLGLVLGFLSASIQSCNDPVKSSALTFRSDPDPEVSTSPSPEPSVVPSVTPSPSPSPSPSTDLYTGPIEVAKYVSKFVDDSKAQGVDVLPDMKNPRLVIQLASLDAYGVNVIGLCESGAGQRRVTFDPDFWDNVSETQRELLAHHELGHCVLYRPHRSDRLENGAYASIMYPIIMGSSTYLNSVAYYLEELFSQTASSGPIPGRDSPVVHVCDHQKVRGTLLSGSER